MDMFNILLWFIKLVQKYGVFDTHDFEYFEIDQHADGQRPVFYLGVFTLREKKE